MSDAGLLRIVASGETFTFRPDEVVTLGRHPESDIAITHSRVSRRHADIAVRGGKWVLSDVGSANGIFIRGELVTEVELPGPVKINLGAIDGPSVTVIPVGGADLAGTDWLSPPVDVTARLVHEGAPPRIVRVGRGPENDVVIDDASVSLDHAELRISDASTEIVDLNSVNGTFVNGARINRADIAELDRVTFGAVTFRYTNAGLRPLNAI